MRYAYWKKDDSKALNRGRTAFSRYIQWNGYNKVLSRDAANDRAPNFFL